MRQRAHRQRRYKSPVNYPTIPSCTACVANVRDHSETVVAGEAKDTQCLLYYFSGWERITSAKMASNRLGFERAHTHVPFQSDPYLGPGLSWGLRAFNLACRQS